jgi:hypothetical protein
MSVVGPSLLHSLGELVQKCVELSSFGHCHQLWKRASVCAILGFGRLPVRVALRLHIDTVFVWSGFLPAVCLMLQTSRDTRYKIYGLSIRTFFLSNTKNKQQTEPVLFLYSISFLLSLLLSF